MAGQPIKENKITPKGKNMFGRLIGVKFEKLNWGKQNQMIKRRTVKKMRFVKSSARAIIFIPRKIKKDKISQKIKENWKEENLKIGENKILKKSPAKIIKASRAPVVPKRTDTVIKILPLLPKYF